MATVACPECGETERLKGTPGGDFIHVACEACGHAWIRSLKKRCRYCGSEDLRYTPVPVWSAGRGTMKTPAGEREAYACKACGKSDVTSADDDES